MKRTALQNMKRAALCFAARPSTALFRSLQLLLLLWPASASARAPTIAFEHVVIIVQENRTPDNLFQGLCAIPGKCSITPDISQYNIQTADWKNNQSPNGVTQPVPIPFAIDYDPGHQHADFVAMCDKSAITKTCLMDGAAGIFCKGPCPPNPQFAYVDNSVGVLNPYLALATQYGWANYMFQTNQGPSLPAHQFLFGATSAPNSADDQAGIFMSENGPKAGCASPSDARIQLIDGKGAEDPTKTIFPCAERDTVADLLSSHGFTWRYYTPEANSLWSAPNLIDHICVAQNQVCTGPEWITNVDQRSSDALLDIANCKLRNVSWIIPTGRDSDHAGTHRDSGPSWVASLVNAIGTSKCMDGARSYWDDTAIFIVWDDWGGWYDHEPPHLLPAPQGGYQYGFRVPLIVVSAYTPKGKILNGRKDFASIIRFVENNFFIKEGALNFADARSGADLHSFFYKSATPRAFQPIIAPLGADYFLNDKSPQLPPDDD